MTIPRVFLAIILLALSSSTFGQMRFVTSGQAASDTERSRVVAAAPSASEAARQVFDILNRKRVAMGLIELEWSDRLAEVARLHSDDMASHDLFSHRGSDGSMVDERADRLHLGAWAGIGENIAFMQNFADPAGTAIEKWLESPSHRGNMLSTQWKETGVGVAVTKYGKYYFTQVFLLRK